MARRSKSGPDDGDEVFEADQDELVFGPAAAPLGMLDTDLLDGGMYWIVETDRAGRLHRLDPILVELNVDPSVTCAWDFGGLDRAASRTRATSRS